MARSKILTSAHCLVFVNGTMVGQACGFQFNNATPKKKIRQLDDQGVVELAPTTNDVDFTLEFWRIKRSGGARGAGIKAVFQQAMQERYLSITILDRENDTVVFRSDYVSCDEESVNIPVKSLAKCSVKCTCLDFQDEIQPFST